jgi:hypothetical protein
VVAVAEPVFTDAETLALSGFLAGYTGLTREAYAPDLRQFTRWCQQRHLRLFQVRRADIECFARDLEAKGKARATVTRTLCTIAGSTGARWKKTSSTTRPGRMSAARGWTTSPVRLGWTATSSAPCWLPLVWAQRPCTR